MTLDRRPSINQDSRPDLKLEQAIFILRRGGAVLIRDVKGNCALVQAAEYADYVNPHLEYMPVSGTLLCLTPQHMRALHKPVLAERPALAFQHNPYQRRKLYRLF